MLLAEIARSLRETHPQRAEEMIAALEAEIGKFDKLVSAVEKEHLIPHWEKNTATYALRKVLKWASEISGATASASED